MENTMVVASRCFLSYILIDVGTIKFILLFTQLDEIQEIKLNFKVFSTSV